MAKQELVPIKVKIGLKENGQAKYPNWGELPLASAGTTDQNRRDIAAKHMPTGWKYDSKYGHKEEGPDSPFGMQWGMLLVTKQFAKEALVKWPTLVTEMTEVEAEDFWRDRYAVDLPDYKADERVLVNLKNELILRKEAGLDTTDVINRIKKAVDPDDDAPGIKHHKLKDFTKAKQTLNIKLVKSDDSD